MTRIPCAALRLCSPAIAMLLLLAACGSSSSSKSDGSADGPRADAATAADLPVASGHDGPAGAETPVHPDGAADGPISTSDGPGTATDANSTSDVGPVTSNDAPPATGIDGHPIG